MENTSDYYYRKLEKTDVPGSVLAAFYCALYRIEQTKSETILFNRLVRTFGRFVVFFAIQDTYGSKPIRIEDPYPYIYEICQRRFESMYKDSSFQSRVYLDKHIAAIAEEIESFKENNKKVKIPSSEGL